ncbi:unnamed protein product [Peniophora sp. CBMAI 1063]|nr:unnamed protein product [Peniophora sp. CBMAI 1063]
MRLPQLVDLDITGVPHLGRIRLHPEERLADKNPLDTKTPALLRLQLRGISLSFHAPRLRSLYIEHHHSGIDATWSIPGLLSMLTRYPLLEHLTLLHAIRPTQDDQASQLAEAFEELSVGPDHLIDFPHLTALRIGGHPRDLITLWRSLAVPRSTSVHFEFTLTLAEPGILITSLLEAVKSHLDDPRNDTVTLRARPSPRNSIEGMIGPASGAAPAGAGKAGSCVFNIALHVPSVLSEQAFAYTLSAFVLTAIPHARTLRLIDYTLGPEPLDFGLSSIHALYVEGPGAHDTAAIVLRNGSLPELHSVEIVNAGDVSGYGAEIAEALQLRAPSLRRLVLRGPVRYLDHREREDELELLRDVVDDLIDQREWEVEDKGHSGKTRKLAGLGVALLLSSVTLLQA